MRKFAFVLATAELALALAGAVPCYALNFHSYVSGKGGGTACTLAAPCFTLANALAATSDGGEISCLDSGFDTTVIFTITQGVTIDCTGVAAAAWQVEINAPNKVVTLRNLTTSDFTPGTLPDDGIYFQNGAALYVENCVLEHWREFAIVFAPPAGVTAKLFVTDSVFRNNTAVIGSGLGEGISIDPASGAVAEVTIEGVKIENASYTGIDASGSTFGVVRDSVVSGIGDTGISVSSGASLLIENTTVADSKVYGLLAQDGAGILVSNSNVVHNNTGLATFAGATLTSFGNNDVSGNTTDGAFTTTIAQQ
jgi:Right handed beta helix region